MRSTRKIRVFLACVVVVLALTAFATSALAQCAMCRAALAGSNNAAFIRNLNLGILILLVPPVAMFCSIFVALRRTGAKDEEGSGAAKDDSAR